MNLNIFRIIFIFLSFIFSLSAFAEMPGESRYHQYIIAEKKLINERLKSEEFISKHQPTDGSPEKNLNEIAKNDVELDGASIYSAITTLTQAEKSPDDPSFGYVSQGGNSTQINWLRYKIMLSDDIAIPIYFLSTKTTTEDNTNKQVEELSSSLLDNKGGELNFKYASDHRFDFNKLVNSKKDDKDDGAVCDFHKSQKGGCYYTWEAGVKSVKFIDSNSNNKYAYAIYGGLGIDLEFPIYSKDKIDLKTPAGRLIFGSSLNTLYTQSDKLNDVFLRDGRNVKLEKDFVLYNDTHASFFINEVISIDAGYLKSFGNDAIKSNSYIKVKYAKVL